MGLRPVAVAALAFALVVPGCLDFGRVTNARTGPGDNARDLLDDATFTKLVVEIDTMSGAAPHADAVNVLKSTLSAVLSKPGGISYDTSGSSSVAGRGENARYSFQEIDAIEEQHRSRYSKGDTAALYVLYVDGGSDEDSGDARVLGAAYHGTSIVMFKGNIKAITRPSGGILPSTQAEERCVERAVLVHEAGHVLGLVNHGTPMVTPHEDANHRGHSASRDSVMYYAVENSQSLLNILGGGCSDIPYQFDSNDRADMKAAGGK